MAYFPVDGNAPVAYIYPMSNALRRTGWEGKMPDMTIDDIRAFIDARLAADKARRRAADAAHYAAYAKIRIARLMAIDAMMTADTVALAADLKKAFFDLRRDADALPLRLRAAA